MKRFLISILTLLFVGVCLGQTLSEVPKKCTAFKPDILYSPCLEESATKKLVESRDYGQTTSNRASKDPWIVYSDRDNNTTYTAPNSNIKFSSLDFNEQLRIAIIRNGWALVYSEPKLGELWPKISKDAVMRGWVPMKHLLLWETCPVNEKGIYKKAMFCVNLDKNTKSGTLGLLYRNPKSKNAYSYISTNFEYYFEFKREDNMVLLAKDNSLNSYSNKKLYGWVSDNSFVAWNQRTCLEPTWEIEDVEYFISKNTKVPVYDSKTRQRATSIGYEKKESEKYDPYLYRMIGNALRYPILDKNSANEWNCSTFSAPGVTTINQGTTKGPEKDAKHKVMDELRNVKIAIVIDGTKSMENYYAPVKEAIKSVTDYFGTAQGVKVKVGVVIYRDYSDGEFVTEVFPLTNKPQNNENLARWLDSGGKGGVKSSSKDHTLEEAMFQGINVAIEKYRFDAKESNFMFVIGDCGNDPKDLKVTRDDIINKLTEYNINLIGFQVRNYSDSPAYGSFNSQLQYIMKSSLRKRYDNFPSMKDKKIVAKKIQDGYDFVPDNTTGATFFYASHKYIANGDMPASKLHDLMTNAFIYVQKTIQHGEDTMTRAEEIIEQYQNGFGKGASGGTITTVEYDFILSRIGKQGVEELKKKNSTVGFEGFTPKHDDSGREYFKTVIFISKDEFNTLIIRLKDLYDVALAKSNDRAPYIKAMKALIQGMIPGITDAEMGAMGIDEVMRLISGVNVKTSTMKKRTLTDIASTAAVKPAEYLSILNEFKIKYQSLQKIKNSEYKYILNEKYYWIPTENLP